MTTLTRSTSDVSQRLVAGNIGGIVFGILMAMMGIPSLIASFVSSQSALVGFLIHMLISAFIGATFGLIFGGRVTGYASGLGWGALYGAVWWILDPLLIMPAMMGMPLFMVNGMSLMSLIGHLDLWGGSRCRLRMVRGAPLISAAIDRESRPRNAPASGMFLGRLCLSRFPSTAASRSGMMTAAQLRRSGMQYHDYSARLYVGRLCELREMGLIELRRGTVALLDLKALEAFAEANPDS
jgi:hypothetical protein